MLAPATIDDRDAERRLLRTASSDGRFAIGIEAVLHKSAQQALERLQMRGWVTLIDVTVPQGYTALMRVFKLSDSAKQWLSNGLH